MVRHILYLGGAGRETPYLSLTEDMETARRFAGVRGRVYRTTTGRLAAAGVGHLSRKDLLQLLKGKGKGSAEWPSAFEVLQARKYVEEWAEHLADFRPCQGQGATELRRLVDILFE